jgi:hypothetical protein
MSGLRFVVCLSLASVVGLVYAGTAAALGGSVVAGLAATSEVAASASVQPGSVQLDATVALSADPGSEPGLSSPAPASASSSVDVKVGTEEAQAPITALASDPESSAPAASIEAPTGSVDLPGGSPKPPDTKARVRSRAPRPARPVRRHDAPPARPTTRLLPLRAAAPVVRPPHQAANGVAPVSGDGTLMSDGSRPPGSAAAGSGGGFGVAGFVILVGFVSSAAALLGRRLRPVAKLARPPALLFVLERPG